MPPIIRLAGVRLKIERARKHIRDLETEANAYLNYSPYPYQLRAEDDPETGDEVYRVKVLFPIPECIPLIVGDAVHNLRSALDHLAWQLVEANGQSPDGRTCFPLCTSPDKYAALDPGKVRGIGPAAIRLIEATQPYQDGYNLLGTLADINNYDKHRLLIVAAVRLGMVGFGVRCDNLPSRVKEAGGSVVATYMVPNRIAEGQPILDDGEELCRAPAAKRGKFAAQFDFSVQIAFREPAALQGRLILPLLTQLTELVESVVDRCVPLFEVEMGGRDS